MQKIVKSVLAFLGLIILDQTTKLFFILRYPGIVDINSGGAFNFLEGRDFYPLLVILILLILGLILIKSKLIKTNLSAIILIYSGAIGDLIDRFRLGGVVDFINLKFWPSFNLADVMIVVGFIWFVWSNFFFQKKTIK